MTPFFWLAVFFLVLALVLGERRPEWGVGSIPHPGYTWSAVLAMLIHIGVK